MDQTDAELVTSYRSGHSQAMTELVNRHLKTVYSFAYLLTKNQDLASDITQNTFIKAWRHLHRFDTEKSFKTWLLSIAKNTTIDELRKRQPLLFSNIEKTSDTDINDSSLLEDLSPLPSVLFEQKELKMKLDAALDQLDINEKAIILLHLEDDLTLTDIAEMLNKPLNTVKSQYRRALHKLRAIIAPKETS